MISSDEPNATAATMDADQAIDPGAATPLHVAVDTRPAVGDGGSGDAAGGLLRRVGHFVLLERLGAGGMGIVYAAFDEKLERKVAIKLVATHGTDERAQQRLLREAQAQARLSHPNVVTVYEVGTLPDGRLFIAMELVKGQTLRAWQHTSGGAALGSGSPATSRGGRSGSREPARSTGRPWQDIVAVYAAAGAGLAAAHRVGLVHRDFKPDNVLFGEDGRARVTDFGLAFAADDPLATGSDPGVAPATSETAISAAASQRALALSAVGKIAGTPGYMAPEQRTGAAVDARTDQFAFCVALYEALHGERPSADAAPPSSSYPRWLWTLLARGLAHDPAARFPSMDALLAELNRGRERPRRRAMVAAAAVGVLGLGGAAYAMIPPAPPEPCPAPTAELAGVWDEASKRAARAAVLGTGVAFAAKVWESTEATLDRYAERWIDAQQAACVATHVKHVQSAELLDRRTECLLGRKRSLAAATKVIVSQPNQAVAHASEILGSLGDIELCADLGVLRQLGEYGAVADPRARAIIAEARSHLAHAGVLLATEDVRGTESVLAGVLDLTAGLSHPPIAAEIDHLQGRLKFARSEVADALNLLNKAIATGIASRHDELVADVYLTLALTGASIVRQPAQTGEWLRQANTWLDRIGHSSDPRRIRLEHARGNLQFANGDAKTALVTLTKTLVDAETLWGDADPRLTPLLSARAAVEAQLGQGQRAVADGERAVSLGLRAWGPDYPGTARSRRALGLLYIRQLGDVARGEAELLAALKLYRAHLGEDSVEVANCEQGLSLVGQYRSDYPAMLEHAERATQILARRLGTDHTWYGEGLTGVGAARYMVRDFPGALSAYQEAFRIMGTALGAEHPNVGILRANIGEALLALERPEAAQEEFDKALVILKKHLGPDNTGLILPFKGLGLAQLSRGHARDAREPLERALVLREKAGSAGDPQELAEIQWGLARTLRALDREPARARALADAALTGYRSLKMAERAAEIARWLGQRR